MRTLRIDVETYSDANLGDVGVYRYADDPSFRILLFGYAYDEEEPTVIDLTSDDLPKSILKDLQDPTVTKTAFNAQFERVTIDAHFGITSGPWVCTMVCAWAAGITGGLKAVGEALGLPQDMQKLTTGKNLIRLFSVARKPSKASGMKKVYTKEDKPEEWATYMEYNRMDVVAEREIARKLAKIPRLEEEQELYELDQKINDRGVLIDQDMAMAAIAIDTAQTTKYTEEYAEITGLQNPNALGDLKTWIKVITGRSVSSITKGNMKELMADFQAYPEVVRALEIRRTLGKSSTAKYSKMIEIVNRDGRARGLLQFYGAQTGRWAGRSIQVQNLPKNQIDDLDTARAAVKTGDLELMEMLYERPSEILSQCIRPAIIPPKGHIFAVADYSAIEARVIAWLSGEKWRLDVFQSHGKIYEASASQMFHVPIEMITKGSPLRQKGKVAELALGYQGGVGALKQMGALKMGIPEDELPGIVERWRKSSPHIVAFWGDVQRAVVKAIREQTTVAISSNLKAIYMLGMLFLELPSGRRLAYAKPRIEPHKTFENGVSITYEDTAKGIRKDTYGGSLVENIVQATARDCLAHAMLDLDSKGYPIVMHVHDEVVIEIPEGQPSKLEDICYLMGKEIPWAKGLPLRADGYLCNYYRKD